MRKSLLVCLALALGAGAPALHRVQAQGLKVKPQAARQIPVQLEGVPKYRLKILFVRLADDDGSKPSSLTEADAQAAIDVANAIYARNRGDIRFEMAPESNFGSVVRNTTMNHDCILQPGWTEAKVNSQTAQDVNGDGTADNDDIRAMCDDAGPVTLRNAFAATRPNRLVVYSRGSSEYVKWEGTHYAFKYASGGHSGGRVLYVAMPDSFGGGTLLGHELGHYLHLPHTFGASSYVPATMADAYAKITAWIATHHGGEPLGCFDGDERDVPAIADTPPDAGGGLFVEVYGDKCDPNKGSIPFVVTVLGKPKTLTLTPDRANILSYFKSCPWPMHLSRDQYAIMDASIATGNRMPLTAPDPLENPCYHALHPEQGSQTDPLASLRDVLRKTANCYILTKRPWRWEMVTDVYAPPERATRAMVRDQALAKLYVDLGRERQLMSELSNSRGVTYEDER